MGLYIYIRLYIFYLLVFILFDHYHIFRSHENRWNHTNQQALYIYNACWLVW